MAEARESEAAALALQRDVAQPNALLSEKVWAGIDRLLTDYAELRAGDDVAVLYTPESRESAAVVGVACERRGHNPVYLPMRPLRDPSFPERLARAVPRSRSRPGKCVVLTFERDTMSHHGAIRSQFADYHPAQVRVVRAINSGVDLFATGLSMTPEELSALNTALIERLAGTRRLRVTTRAGTDLEIRLDNERFRFISNRGMAQSPQFIIIPAGEVATFPAEISGTLAADFALNMNMIYDGDVRLSDRPVVVEIEDGAATRLRCDDRQMQRFLEEGFARANARRVGELGFGTNKAVVEAVPENSHLNERVPGVHLGFGQHNQTNESTGYECDIHIDLCAKGGRLWFDDGPVPLDLEALAPSARPHPEMARDEDVFSEELQGEDCCGLVRS